ncbi:MAG: putative GTP-binding protein EngB [candidate division BRC1 bacterium ADurb.BinA364]|nr:MAG: putative GTP-binding protein EngB [candidate division BRC1 bacterium ADurb.BinA364]
MCALQIKSVRFVKSAVAANQLLRDPLPRIAFAGRSNVGKSSLINTLLERKNMARASSTPGRTREVNYFLVNESFYLVDLPGYGYAKIAKSARLAWEPLIEAAIRDDPMLRLVVMILDARRIPGDLDLRLMDWLEDAGKPYLPILTKRDKLSNNEYRMQEQKIKEALGLEGPDPMAVFSAKTRLGRAELLGTIAETLKNSSRESSEGEPAR